MHLGSTQCKHGLWLFIIHIIQETTTKENKDYFSRLQVDVTNGRPRLPHPLYDPS
jgi:hypothetical protein